jgi:hypothetical protein
MVKACHQADQNNGPVGITYYELPVLLVNIQREADYLN